MTPAELRRLQKGAKVLVEASVLGRPIRGRLVSVDEETGFACVRYITAVGNRAYVEVLPSRLEER